MTKKPYVPTDPKATHIAGQRIRSLPVMLTDSQAEHELRIQAIKPYEEKVDKAQKKV